ncbi:hypothetical protein DOTSEDRAFT_136755 [Dothistroma septosporum NZE10]|uniref:Epoxide hydrolase N-terminal domain-containing protein n=1 Tax=Dothistroma septosporum (strain NZE10 / CBS 128990) TaxID=675120 RepID=N1PF90_DOTSN|nr:hypothetical protein DOTSEDRAFT_136755 [Dothistroma septosporum NZE10]
MSEVKKYSVNVPQAKIDRLKRRLEDTDFPNELEDAGWDYGSPLTDIKRFVEYWKTEFDWRAHEKKLNELPNYEVQVNVDKHGPVDMHFIHQKCSNPNAIPLLFVHGWPGSFLEVTKILPLLANTSNDSTKPSFHIVAPSLPNYGFSGPALKRGFNIARCAEACHKVMLALGYDQYVTQGGDTGFLITRAMAHLYPQHVKACHVNWAWAAKPEEYANGAKPEPEYSEREKKHLAMAERWWAGEGRGYLAIQSTRPATINFALRDSPVGLLAWIWDKMVEWSDDYPWTEDEVCLWVSLYVFSRAGPDATTYLYYEILHDASEITLPTVQGYIDVPLGIADFPVEICNSPVSWRESMGPIVFQKIYEKGGHFAGWERPSDIADGLCEMFGKNGGAHGVVAGKSGH